VNDNYEYLKTTYKEKLLLGTMSILLPILVVLDCVVFGTGHLPTSISATYYQNAAPIFIGFMFICSAILFFFSSGNKNEKIFKIVMGFACVLIIIFPTDTSSASSFSGVFNLPPGVSNYAHLVFAVAFFTMSGIHLILFQAPNSNLRSNYKKWNYKLHIICGLAILTFLGILSIGYLFHLNRNFPFSLLMETLILVAFSLSNVTEAILTKSELKHLYPANQPE
jgi:hypothetical protein